MTNGKTVKLAIPNTIIELTPYCDLLKYDYTTTVTTPYLDSLGELSANAVREVGRERSVDVRAQLVEVDLDNLVVRSALVGAQVLLERVRRRSDARSLGRLL